MFYFISPNNCVSTSAVLIERKIFDQNMHQCIPPLYLLFSSRVFQNKEVPDRSEAWPDNFT